MTESPTTRAYNGVPFTTGGIVDIDAVPFVIHHFTKRGMILRPLKHSPPGASSPEQNPQTAVASEEPLTEVPGNRRAGGE